jgi:hypothetical protein
MALPISLSKPPEKSLKPFSDLRREDLSRVGRGCIIHVQGDRNPVNKRRKITFLTGKPASPENHYP